LVTTSSTWGEPPPRFYHYLDLVEQAVGVKPTLTVVGCADGKFVLPAARRGWVVRAVDVDVKMIVGTSALPGLGIPAPVLGLRRRLEIEALTDQVGVQIGDFMEVELEPSDALWASGCLQYSRNSHHDAATLTDRLRRLLRPGGYAHIEYMIPDEEKLIGRPNCPSSEWWRQDFPKRGWRVLQHNVDLDELDPPHPYMPTIHRHSWGRLLALRRK
jgi:SAM-dependent methyltransferase